MTVKAGASAPYAPPAAVIEVLRRYRERGLATPFTTEVLERAGVSDTLTRRTLASLKQLGLIDSEGNPSPEFEAASRAPDDEYKQALGELLLGFYADVISFADPAEDNFDRVRDAFRGYDPRGQQDRMVTLFLGLLDYAGLDTSAATATRKRAEPGQRQAKKATDPRNSRRSADKHGAGQRASGKGDEQPKPEIGGGLPPGLLGLLHQIPRDGAGWPRARRDEFMAAFSAVLDFTVPVREQEPAPTASDDAEGEAR